MPKMAKCRNAHFGIRGPKLHTGTPRGTKQYIDRGELVRRLLRPPPTPPPGVGTGTPKKAHFPGSKNTMRNVFFDIFQKISGILFKLLNFY